jgi:hypothetical protein
MQKLSNSKFEKMDNSSENLKINSIINRNVIIDYIDKSDSDNLLDLSINIYI